MVKKIIIILLSLASLLTYSAKDFTPIPWVVLYSAQAQLKDLLPYKVIVLDSESYPPVLDTLALSKKHIVLGYISAGEVEQYRDYFNDIKAQNILIAENPFWPGSFYVDSRDPVWEDLIINRIIPELKKKKFDGIMLDTLDNQIELERQDPKKYKGLKKSVVLLIKNIRKKYPNLKIMVNRAYEILPDVAPDIDYILAESLRADYNFEKNSYQYTNHKLYEKQVKDLQKLINEHENLAVLSLDYWYPMQKKEIRKIYNIEINNGFSPYVSTIKLNKIIPPPHMIKHRIKNIIILLILTLNIFAAEDPRVIIALYDSKSTPKIKSSLLHRFAEMPLNHLGMVLEYHDILQGYPDIKDRPDVRGVISWYRNNIENTMPNPLGYMQWANDVITAGKKFVILGHPGFSFNPEDAQLYAEVQKFLKLLGLRSTGISYQWRHTDKIIVPDENLYNFERKLIELRFPFAGLEIIAPDTYSVLNIKTDSQKEHITSIITYSPNGGIVAKDYAMFSLNIGGQATVFWYLNPFEYFRRAFGLELFPTPDVTTLNGSRVLYSHIDGDGWNNVSNVGKSAQHQILSSEIIYDEVFKKYPDLPVTVGPVGAELDEAWSGLPQSKSIAEKIFLLPNIEAGSHTFSHPFYWRFFENYYPDKEEKYLKEYTVHWDENTLQNIGRHIKNMWEKRREKVAEDVVHYEIYYGLGDWLGEFTKGKLPHGYDMPRGYASQPYSTKLEITGSIDYMQKLLPPGKKVEMIQWSGDTTPYPEAVKMAYDNNVLNINTSGGRFDKDFPSYAWLYPFGIMVGGYRQVYATNSNEYEYTDNWLGPYHGFNKLIQTLENTEHPIRIKPMNIYYHMYSGEFDESLKALLDNIKYAQNQNSIAVTTSFYIYTVLGFYSTKIFTLDKLKWQIKDRNKLSTIRFDHADKYNVDFQTSQGILGQQHYQHSLYIFLDPSIDIPVINITDDKNYTAKKTYLIRSSWKIWDLQNNPLKFNAQGYGKGKFSWYVPHDGKYTILFD
jgi:uncharacterized protein (TIGR01370 family)